MSCTRIDTFWLIALTIGSLVVRLIGIDSGVPHRRESDTYIVVQVEELRRDAEGSRRRPAFRKYPHLLARMLTWGPIATATAERDADSLLNRAAAPLVTARTLVALLSALLVPATWFLARMLFGRGVAYLAALFVATSLLHFTFSQQARPHAPHATLATLSVIASICYVRHGGTLRALVAGLAAAAAVSCLQFGFFVLPALGAALALRTPLRGRRLVIDGLIAAAPVAVAVVMFYPWVLSDPVRAGDVADAAALIGSHGSRLPAWRVSNLPQVWSSLFGYDPVLLVLALGGGLSLLVSASRTRGDRHRWTPELGVVASFLIPFLLVVGGVLQNQERFLLPMIPFLSLLAALAVHRALSSIARDATRRGLIATLTCGSVAVLAFPAGLVTKAAWLYSRPDTLTHAARWLEANADRHRDVILVEPDLDLPLVSVDPRRTTRRMGRGEWQVYQDGVDRATRRELGYRIHTLLPRGPEQRTPEVPARHWTTEDVISIARETSARFICVWETSLDASLSPALRAAFGEPVADFPAVRPWRPSLRRGYGYQGVEMIRRIANGVARGEHVSVYVVD